MKGRPPTVASVIRGVLRGVTAAGLLLIASTARPATVPVAGRADESFEAMRAIWNGAPPHRDSDARFAEAERNGRLAAEAFFRSRKYVDGWLALADARSGLIPRNRKDAYWNGRDAAADNYSFMVLTAALTDTNLLHGRLRTMLDAETRLTSRIGRMPDDFDFTTQTWRRTAPDLDSTIFDGAEYVKDGLLYITEWLGPSPWFTRMTGIVEDVWANARVETPFGVIPTRNFEVNGDLLQVCSRLFFLTGERKHLERAARLGDYYLLGTNHPTRDLPRLHLGDHSCEVINGLSELYLAVSRADPARHRAYRVPLHELYDRLLEIGRDSNGMFHAEIDTRTGAASGGLTDNWGYNLDGIYTAYLVDGTPEYRAAARKALASLAPHCADYVWERGSADGYADAIEGALTLLQREPDASAFAWVDRNIRTLWSKQQPDGVIEGWHGDGNFARTSLMYALWKTQGCRADPWRSDLRLGAVREGDSLHLSLTADHPWTGRILVDRPRHRTIMHLPVDYPRINQFPEWFAFPPEAFPDGIPVSLLPGEELRLTLRRDSDGTWRAMPPAPPGGR
jgi:hypothetical protein